MQTKSERFEMRLEQSVLESVDRWRSAQRDLPSRAEAIRRLIDIALAPPGSPALQLTGGEKLILMMLRDIHKGLKVKGEMEPDFISDAICDGHLWGLEWRYRGLFGADETPKEAVSQVVDILDMWSFLESGYAKLSKEDQKRIAEQDLRFSKHVQFLGFDGNYETEYMSIARFLIDKLERFTSFAGRELNSHMPLLDTYMRMVPLFQPIRARLHSGEMSANEIISLLRAAEHPGGRKSPASH